MIKKDLVWEIELTNNVIIAIKTCSFRGIRGYTLIGAVCEEISFWRDSETSANPAQEILTALRPALATIPNSFLLAISTPYSRSGVLWEQYREHYGSDDPDAPMIWRADTLTMNPTVDKNEIARGLKEDKSAARSEWLAEFREDVETFLPQELIESAIVEGRLELPRIEGITYHAFTDPSGGRADSFTLGIAHVDPYTKKLILDVIKEARPPFVPSNVTREFCQILRRYNIGAIRGDRYSAEWAASEFRKNGIMYEASEMTASELYLNALPLFANHSIELLDHRRLCGQLRSLERRTRSGGKDLVSHYPGGHDDLANAAAGACVFASMVEENDREILLELFDQEEEYFSKEEDLEDMQRRMTAFLLGAELEPSKEEKEGRPRIQKGKTVLTVSEWNRHEDKT